MRHLNTFHDNGFKNAKLMLELYKIDPSLYWVWRCGDNLFSIGTSCFFFLAFQIPDATVTLNRSLYPRSKFEFEQDLLFTVPGLILGLFDRPHWLSSPWIIPGWGFCIKKKSFKSSHFSVYTRFTRNKMTIPQSFFLFSYLKII